MLFFKFHNFLTYYSSFSPIIHTSAQKILNLFDIISKIIVNFARLKEQNFSQTTSYEQTLKK
jgi:hypothetical protein